jgi:hypothetical protein
MLSNLWSALIDIQREPEKEKVVEEWQGFSDTQGPTSDYESQIIIYKTFTWMPKRCYDSGRWIWGKAFVDGWKHYYHPQEAHYGVLAGEYKVEERG